MLIFVWFSSNPLFANEVQKLELLVQTLLNTLFKFFSTSFYLLTISKLTICLPRCSLHFLCRRWKGILYSSKSQPWSHKASWTLGHPLPCASQQKQSQPRLEPTASDMEYCKCFTAAGWHSQQNIWSIGVLHASFLHPFISVFFVFHLVWRSYVALNFHIWFIFDLNLLNKRLKTTIPVMIYCFQGQS